MDRSRTTSEAKRPGRPSKLTPEVEEKLISALSVGAFRADAAAFAGIGVSTLYSWLERGEADQEQGVASPFRALVAAVEAAEAKSDVDLLDLITQAAAKDWRAAAWRLERKSPTKWGNKQRPAEEMTTEQFAAYVSKLEEQLTSQEEGSS